MQGKNEEAIQALRKFRGRTADLKQEINDLISEEEHRQSQHIGKALKRTSSRKAMLIAFGLMFFQQLSGVNAVIFYTTTIFSEAKFDLKPESATIVIGVIQVLSTIVATMTVDKVGRRLLLVVSDSLMAICTLTLGVYYGVKERSGDGAVEGYGMVPLLSLCVFISAFSLGFGPVAWIMIGEIIEE
jgi:Na+/melibiose symporter-like transporter